MISLVSFFDLLIDFTSSFLQVSVEPYISPSEQALRQQQAEEEERIRLLLLADNFRELALIKMMDGVLEIRLEDELKKDIPKPKCMVSCKWVKTLS